MVDQDKRQGKVFTGIIILVHLVYFLLAWHYTRIYMGDSFEYIYEALNIKNHAFFYSGNPALPIEPEYMTQRQPLYPLFLMAVYLFTVNNWMVLLLQNALSIFNVLYTRKILFRLGYNSKYDWLLLLLVIAYPAQFINANTIAPDILLQTFTLLYFGSFVDLQQTRQAKFALWMSLWLICGMFVKPVLYPFVAVHIVILIVVTIWTKLSTKSLALAALLPICAVLLYNYWNYNRTGKFHFSSNQAFNAIYYYYPYVFRHAGQDSAARFLQAERRAIAAAPDYKGRYEQANARGATLLKVHFGSYMFFHLTHSARILIEPGKAELDLFTGKLTYGKLYSKEQTGFLATWKSKGMRGMGEYFRNNPSMIVVIIVLLFNLVRLLGLYLFITNRRNHWLIRLFVAGFICYFAIAAGPIANTRYFLPVSLIAIGAAVLGYVGRSKKQIA